MFCHMYWRLPQTQFLIQSPLVIAWAFTLLEIQIKAKVLRQSEVVYCKLLRY